MTGYLRGIAYILQVEKGELMNPPIPAKKVLIFNISSILALSAGCVPGRTMPDHPGYHARLTNHPGSPSLRAYSCDPHIPGRETPPASDRGIGEPHGRNTGAGELPHLFVIP